MNLCLQEKSCTQMFLLKKQKKTLTITLYLIMNGPLALLVCISPVSSITASACSALSCMAISASCRPCRARSCSCCSSIFFSSSCCLRRFSNSSFWSACTVSALPPYKIQTHTALQTLNLPQQQQQQQYCGGTPQKKQNRLVRH